MIGSCIKRMYIAIQFEKLLMLIQHQIKFLFCESPTSSITVAILCEGMRQARLLEGTDEMPTHILSH